MSAPKIIIPIRPASVALALRQICVAAKAGDIVEVWLDGIKNLDAAKVQTIVRGAKSPLILNLKNKKERGRFVGSDAQRLELLQVGVKAGAEFIDLPLDFPPNLIRQFRRENPRTKLILSFHDFAKMPPIAKLRTLARQAEQRGAAIIKIVGTAKKWSDNRAILQIASELAARKKKFIVLAMGQRGELTRVIAPLLGGFGMFAPLDKKSATAAGQLTAAELQKWWQDFR